jgi:putative transposase
MIQEHNYDSDLTDDQYFKVEGLLPKDAVLGRPKKYGNRIMLNAILWWLRNDEPLRNLPKDFPPWGTVHATSWLWYNQGILPAIAKELGDKELTSAMAKKIRR